MRDQKIASIQNIPAGLPGMTLEDDLFSDFTMSPKDMKLEVLEPDNTTWDTCINMTVKAPELVRIYEINNTIYICTSVKDFKQQFPGFKYNEDYE